VALPNIAQAIRQYNPYYGYYYTNSCVVHKTLGYEIFNRAFFNIMFAYRLLNRVHLRIRDMPNRLKILSDRFT
jgi:hypothetical protein